MEDTSGFYKKFEDESWIHAPNFVYSKDYSLERNGNREETDGWKWYETAPTEYLLWEILNNQQLNGNTE
jgi:hypothetical protein